jgi:hypothetical protein
MISILTALVLMTGNESETDDEKTKAAQRSCRNCEICSEQPAKYRCPGCEIRSCSLDCSKKHKEESGCNGKRDRLKFVSIQEFDDRQLLSGRYMCIHEIVAIHVKADDNCLGRQCIEWRYQCEVNFCVFFVYTRFCDDFHVYL